ncbi:TetR family transcriptional regulator [Conexibacter sp. JD483]|uniref:TetR/AcrR family transcriptional regulator n=1 Tax=unclassified Conexibacter TaxID=2627773 RepID=UPI00271D1C4F|nr:MULTISPECIES: TetR family transcriptional regulator [unclassified Conexibacter]MDO8187138.1 TetR family transcriptional regulator [Conexibacter sp. CPCC 205706]MDO8200314.1 TetR family transcriptional regulator [Conexibacter sp. CPCC 205762]MDR9368890.1 TetR family transcriptional regulator [Conexibacter sp. JD483]
MSDRRPRRGQPRDPERTRQALLDAALVEFAAKGLAGARVSEIAARAGVNKQLISYHFDGKQGLYEALGERWLAREQEFADPALPLGELVVHYMRESVRDREMTRLFLREALEGGPDPAEAHASRDREELEDLRRRQQAGELDARLDPAFVMLVLQAIASAGAAFPGDARRLTGLDPGSEQFADRYAEQLRLVAELLSGGG